MAGESAREGRYRTAHQRLITNSEEIAFYDGSERELSLVNQSLRELYSYARNQRYVRAAVDCTCLHLCCDLPLVLGTNRGGL